MSFVAFQQAMADLVMSPARRVEIHEDPAAGLAAFDLTAAERERLIALAADPGPGFRTATVIHRSFRLSMLANTLPLTCRALGAFGVRDVMQAYWEEHLPRNFYYAAEARRFGGFARAWFAREGFAHPLLPEVLEVEIALHDLAETAPWPGVEGAAGSAQVAAALADPGAWSARLAAGCRLLRFRRDPAVVLAELRAGRPVPELPEGEHYLLLVARPDREVDHRALDSASGRLLYACDGETSLAALAAAAVGDDVHRPIDALLATGYLELAPAGALSRFPEE